MCVCKINISVLLCNNEFYFIYATLAEYEHRRHYISYGLAITINQREKRIVDDHDT